MSRSLTSSNGVLIASSSDSRRRQLKRDDRETCRLKFIKATACVKSKQRSDGRRWLWWMGVLPISTCGSCPDANQGMKIKLRTRKSIAREECLKLEEIEEQAMVRSRVSVRHLRGLESAFEKAVFIAETCLRRAHQHCHLRLLFALLLLLPHPCPVPSPSELYRECSSGGIPQRPFRFGPVPSHPSNRGVSDLRTLLRVGYRGVAEYGELVGLCLAVGNGECFGAALLRQDGEYRRMKPRIT